MTECHKPFSGHLDLFCRIIVSRTYLLYYLRWESQICCIGYIFGCWCVTYHFYVTVILTYDLVSRITVSGAYPILFDVGIPNLVCWFLFGWWSGAYHFGSLWPRYWLLASFLDFSCLEHISYITANFPQMCLMLDQFLWGHSSCDCDISYSDAFFLAL